MPDIKVKINHGGSQTINAEVKRSLKLKNQDKIITKNGIYTPDVGYTGFGTVTVDINAGKKYGATIESFLGDVDENGVLQQPTEEVNLKFTGVKKIDTDNMFYYAFYKKPSVVSVDFDTVEYIGNYSFYNAFAECPNITSVKFPSLKEPVGRGLYYAFSKCYNITSLSFPVLESIGEAGLSECFRYCEGITSVSFPLLKNIADSGMYGTFYYNENLAEISFPLLETVGYQGMQSALSGCAFTSMEFPSLTTAEERGFSSSFGGCSNLRTVSFPKLKSAGKACFLSAFHMQNNRTLVSVSFPVLESIGESCFQSAFYSCAALNSISFPSLTSVQSNSFGSSSSYAFRYCSNLKEIHFRADMQETISALTGYADKWGATKATIYFDL